MYSQPCTLRQPFISKTFLSQVTTVHFDEDHLSPQQILLRAVGTLPRPFRSPQSPSKETQPPATLPLWLFICYSAVWNTISPRLSTFTIPWRKWREALKWNLPPISHIMNMVISPLVISHVEDFPVVWSEANEKNRCCRSGIFAPY